MTFINVFLELMKYIVPAGFVLAGVFLVMRENQKRLLTEQRYGIYQKTLADLVPLRLQAYERAVLFLERISPENLLIRVDARGKESGYYHQELISEIRAEFEHNFTQQLYIKNESWKTLVSAKEQVISLINQAGQTLSPKAQGIDLGRAILNKLAKVEIQPTHQAIRVIKEDVQGMFRL